MGRYSIHLGAAWQPPCPDAAAADGGGDGCRWRRSFGRPSGVGPTERVLFVLDRPGASAGAIRLALNGIPLPPIGPGPCLWEHDVTAMLADRNELVLDPCGVALPGPRDQDRHGRAALPAAIGRLTLEIVSD